MKSRIPTLRKDLADVEALAHAQGASLNIAAIRAQLVDLMGEDDERVREWDGIVTGLPALRP